MVKYEFAQQVLLNSKIKIYSGNNQILKANLAQQPTLPEFNTNFILNHFISTAKNPIQLIESYDDLLRMGFQISRQSVRDKRFRYQKTEYFLVKSSSGLPHIGGIPADHRLQYNYVENWIRLIGMNSSGAKIHLKNSKRIYRKKLNTIEDYEGYFDKYLMDISPYTYQEAEEIIDIPEMPLIMTHDGKVVCLPRTQDNPTIGIFGKKGKGKTLLMHRIADCLYWKWKQRVMIANDSVSFQTRSWSQPWDSVKHAQFILGSKSVRGLKQIGETTRPLPCVYLVPNTNDLRKVELENEVAFRIAMPFKTIMENPNTFFEGTKDEMQASEKYLKNLIYDDNGEIRPDGLIYAKDLNEIHALVNEKTWEEQTIMSGKSQFVQRKEIYKIPETSRGKIFNVLKELYHSKTFDINTNIQSKWIVENTFTDEKESMYPWDACLYANLVPVMITDNIRTHKYFSSIQRFIMEDLFYSQSRNDFIKRNNLEIWMLIDELQSVIKKSPPALETFTKINKEARFNRMGICYAVQYIDDVSEPVLLTTDYLITFQQNSDEAKKISKNFNLLKRMEKDLVMLNKYECMIAGDAGKPLVVYSQDGEREVIDDGTPFRGIIFPSISQHSAPKEEGI